jgi:hypothetical protein
MLRMGCDAVLKGLPQVKGIQMCEGFKRSTHGCTGAKRTQLIKFTADRVDFGLLRRVLG